MRGWKNSIYKFLPTKATAGSIAVDLDVLMRTPNSNKFNVYTSDVKIVNGQETGQRLSVASLAASTLLRSISGRRIASS